MGPSFCVLGCNIALAGSGYITSSDTNSGTILAYYIIYIYNIDPISILYIYIFISICVGMHDLQCILKDLKTESQRYSQTLVHLLVDRDRVMRRREEWMVRMSDVLVRYADRNRELDCI